MTIKHPDEYTVPCEAVADFMQMERPLTFQAEQKTVLEAQQLPQGLFLQDFIVDASTGETLGQAELNIGFPNVAPLFLPNSVYAMTSPLSSQIRFPNSGPRMLGYVNEKQDWVVKPGQQIPASVEINSPWQGIFNTRNVIPFQLALYFNRSIGMTKYKMKKDLQRIAYTFYSGPFMRQWIKRGVTPSFIGQFQAGTRLRIMEKMECQAIYSRLTSHQLAHFESMWPNTARQVRIIWDPVSNKFGNYTLCLCDYASVNKQLQTLTPQDVTLAWLKSTRATLKVELQEFFANTLNILQNQNGDDTFTLIVNDSLLKKPQLGPAVDQELGENNQDNNENADEGSESQDESDEEEPTE